MRRHGSDRGPPFKFGKWFDKNVFVFLFFLQYLAGDVPAGAVDKGSHLAHMGQFLQDRNFGQNVAI